MEPSTQKLIYTFGALADLGQEVANGGDFNEMVRTSMHLLLGTLALRRGAVVECGANGVLDGVAIWGLDEQVVKGFVILEGEKDTFIQGEAPSFLVREPKSHNCTNAFLDRYRDRLVGGGVELVIPMLVRGELTGFVLLGGKASGEEFSVEDFETIRAMVRHIGVGIHTHRLLEQVARVLGITLRPEKNGQLVATDAAATRCRQECQQSKRLALLPGADAGSTIDLD